MDFSFARYFLKWSWLSSTASSRTFLFLSGMAYSCGRGKEKKNVPVHQFSTSDKQEDR